ncbi:MAG: hypothetical protein IJA89_00185 [Clostridia bacterium]|nr:hypothetical protein [Clostridiales bacterium]MBQ3505172.1 hypothetical protein [Clostridia bacterium]
MLLFLQIAFIILSALCAGATLIVGALVSWGYAGLCVLLTLLFLGLSLLCKQSLAMKNLPKDDENKPDFMNK